MGISLEMLGDYLAITWEVLGTLMCLKKIKKFSESPGTVPVVAKLYKNDSMNRKVNNKQVQPAIPHLGNLFLITMEKLGGNEIWS